MGAGGPGDLPGGRVGGTRPTEVGAPLSVPLLSQLPPGAPLCRCPCRDAWVVGSFSFPCPRSLLTPRYLVTLFSQKALSLLVSPIPQSTPFCGRGGDAGGSQRRLQEVPKALLPPRSLSRLVQKLCKVNAVGRRRVPCNWPCGVLRGGGGGAEKGRRGTVRVSGGKGGCGRDDDGARLGRESEGECRCAGTPLYCRRGSTVLRYTTQHIQWDDRGCRDRTSPEAREPVAISRSPTNAPLSR